MNKQEAAKVLSIMQANYPDSFKGKTDEMMLATISLWATMFADDNANDVTAAVMAHIAADTGAFMPNIGMIKDRLGKMRNQEELTEQEAWNLVQSALRNGIYGSREEYAKLPPMVQRMVGSANQLKEWAMMDADTVQSVVASNFQRSYKVRAQNEREYQALPSSVREIMGRLADGMKMPQLGDGD